MKGGRGRRKAINALPANRPCPVVGTYNARGLPCTCVGRRGHSPKTAFLARRDHGKKEIFYSVSIGVAVSRKRQSVDRRPSSASVRPFVSLRSMRTTTHIEGGRERRQLFFFFLVLLLKGSLSPLLHPPPQPLPGGREGGRSAVAVAPAASNLYETEYGGGSLSFRGWSLPLPLRPVAHRREERG